MSPHSLTADRAESEWASRRRHPSMRPGVGVGRLRERVADAMELGGTAHPEVAAAILSGRGRSGLSLADFAHRAGVPAEVLAEAEAGRLARDELPGVLRRLVPHPDR